MILAADRWEEPALASLIIAAILYPVLVLLEQGTWFSDFFVEKSSGEIKKSFLFLFIMFAALTAVCWGIFNQPGILAAAILMWGTGDAAAALTGIPYGKHKIKLPFTDGKKSWEGSGAMFAVSLLVGTFVLLYVQKLSLPHALLSAALTAFLGTATELFSGSEYDTVTVPAVMAAVLLLLARV